jgi:hypothetical protein
MEGYRHNILDVLSPYFRTGWYELKIGLNLATNFEYPTSETQSSTDHSITTFSGTPSVR